MLQKTINVKGETVYSGRINLTKTLAVAGFFLALGGFIFMSGLHRYNNPGAHVDLQRLIAVKAMLIGGVSGGLALLVAFSLIKSKFYGPALLTLSTDKISLTQGPRTKWAAWTSLAAFQLIGKGPFVGAKITGDGAGGKNMAKGELFIITLPMTRQDAPELLKELNLRRARVTGEKYDEAYTAKIAESVKTTGTAGSRILYRLGWLFGTFGILFALGIFISVFLVRTYGVNPQSCNSSLILISVLIAVGVSRYKSYKKYGR